MIGKWGSLRKTSQQAIPSLLFYSLFVMSHKYPIPSPSTPSFPWYLKGCKWIYECMYSFICVCLCVYVVLHLDGGAELDDNSELGQHILKRFPLHMYARLESIRHTWVTFWKMDKVRTYIQSRTYHLYPLIFVYCTLLSVQWNHLYPFWSSRPFSFSHCMTAGMCCTAMVSLQCPILWNIITASHLHCFRCEKYSQSASWQVSRTACVHAASASTSIHW